MSRVSGIRDRYLRDDVSIRRGGLAAHRARIESFSDDPKHDEVVRGLVRESQLFIEWTATDLQGEQLLELAGLQRLLLTWHKDWAAIWADPGRRGAVAEKAAGWSRRILAFSGLCA